LHGEFLTVGITDVFGEIGVGKFFCFDHDVEGFRGTEGVVFLAERKRFHDVEHFEGGNSLPVWRKFEDGPIAVGSGDGLDPFGGVGGEILGGHDAAVVLDGFEDARGDFAGVEGVAAVGGDLLERVGEIGIAKEFAGFRGAIVGQIEFCGGIVTAEKVDCGGPIHRDPFGDGKTVLRGVDGGGEIFAKFFASEFVGELLPAVDRAGNGNGVDAGLRHIAKAKFFERSDGERGGSPTAGVEAVKFVGFGVVDNGEKIAADAVHHGGDHAHHGVGGDGGVHGVATLFENAGAGLRGEGRFGGDDAAARDDHGAGLRAVLRWGVRDKRHAGKIQESGRKKNGTSHVRIPQSEDLIGLG